LTVDEVYISTVLLVMSVSYRRTIGSQEISKAVHCAHSDAVQVESVICG